MGLSRGFGGLSLGGLGGFSFGGFGSLFALPLLKSADGGSSELEAHFLTANHDGLGLEVGLPDLAGLLLGKRNVVAELFSFSGNVAGVGHDYFLKTTCIVYSIDPDKSTPGRVEAILVLCW